MWQSSDHAVLGRSAHIALPAPSDKAHTSLEALPLSAHESDTHHRSGSDGVNGNFLPPTVVLLNWANSRPLKNNLQLIRLLRSRLTAGRDDRSRWDRLCGVLNQRPSGIRNELGPSTAANQRAGAVRVRDAAGGVVGSGGAPMDTTGRGGGVVGVALRRVPGAGVPTVGR